MPLHNVGPRDIPTPDDTAYYREEREAYTWSPPNPHAPKDSPEYVGWGIPPNRAAPIDAVDWVLGHYRQEELKLFDHDPRDRNRYVPLHPKFTWALAAATFAHFDWFKTGPGGQYINRFFGIQEVDPFFDGFVYFWKRRPEDDPYQLTSGNLRIWRQWERVVEPACPGDRHDNPKKQPFDQMKRLLTHRRSPYARTEPPEHMEEVFNWVSDFIRRWFLESQVDESWPFYRKGRLSGAEWVRRQKQDDGSPVWEALSKIAGYHRANYQRRSPGPVRAYRFQRKDGRVYWCSDNEMGVMPLTDYHRKLKRDMNDQQVTAKFGCRACRHVRSCVPSTGNDHLCCHCFSKEVEHGTDRPTLDRCTMLPECRTCPDRIDSNSDLVRIKQSWNRSPRTGPVPR
jgi:hypothetical protein